MEYRDHEFRYDAENLFDADSDEVQKRVSGKQYRQQRSVRRSAANRLRRRIRVAASAAGGIATGIGSSGASRSASLSCRDLGVLLKAATTNRCADQRGVGGVRSAFAFAVPAAGLISFASSVSNSATCTF